MSDTILYRKWDYLNKKHIFSDCASCEYDECWDSATKHHGVYCDSTFYPRCWDTSIQNWKVTVGCCGSEMISGTCCGSGCTEMPKYINITFSGIENAGAIREGFLYCTNEGMCADECNLSFTLEHQSFCTWYGEVIYPSEGVGSPHFCQETYKVTFTMSGSGKITIEYKVSFDSLLSTIFYHTSNIGSGPCTPCHDLPKSFANQNTDYNPLDLCMVGWHGNALVSY